MVLYKDLNYQVIGNLDVASYELRKAKNAVKKHASLNCILDHISEAVEHVRTAKQAAEYSNTYYEDLLKAFREGETHANKDSYVSTPGRNINVQRCWKCQYDITNYIDCGIDEDEKDHACSMCRFNSSTGEMTSFKAMPTDMNAWEDLDDDF